MAANGRMYCLGVGVALEAQTEAAVAAARDVLTESAEAVARGRGSIPSNPAYVAALRAIAEAIDEAQEGCEFPRGLADEIRSLDYQIRGAIDGSIRSDQALQYWVATAKIVELVSRGLA